MTDAREDQAIFLLASTFASKLTELSVAMNVDKRPHSTMSCMEVISDRASFHGFESGRTRERV